MKNAVLLLFLFGLLFKAYSQNTPDDTYVRSADGLLTAAVQNRSCVGISAGFSIDGRPGWQSAAGFKNQKARKPMEINTTTRIASITKPMTAVAILQLYEQNKIDLDLPIQRYLPNFPQKKAGDITIRQLLSHSSGIGGYQSDRERENTTHYADLQAALDRFQDRELLARPGTEFNYSTYNYVLLGRIIEQVSGMSYEEYLKTHIWGPAGMTQTGIENDEQTYPDQSALYHKNSNGKIKSAKRTNLSDRIPGGGVYSNVPDMLKFGDALLGYALLKETTLQEMWKDPGLKTMGNGYGLGWYLYGENPKYGKVFGHNGTQTGASTFLMLLPEQKTTIIVLSNTSGAIQEVTDITIRLFDLSAAAKTNFEK